MSGDNGQDKPIDERTPEVLATERLLRYQANPESFTENTDLVLGVKKTANGLAYILGNNTPNGLKILKWDVDAQIDAAIYNIIAASKSKIVPVKHGIMDFVRRK